MKDIDAKKHSLLASKQISLEEFRSGTVSDDSSPDNP